MFENHLAVKKALSQRNKLLANFWFSEATIRVQPNLQLTGKKVIMVDAEDTFTQMLAQQITAIGLSVTIKKFNEINLLKRDWDLIVVGPGPGDPSSVKDQRIVKMRSIISRLLTKRYPFLAVCLSHQLLCQKLGLSLICKELPNQGLQREIDFFGTRELVGFYNTYVAKCEQVQIEHLQKMNIEISYDVTSKEVYALRGGNFVSLQFHPESLLTRNGINIISSSIKRIINA